MVHLWGIGVTIKKAADWDKVIELTLEILSKDSKDFQVASWLLEALVKKDGFEGLQVGFKVLGELLFHYWDTGFPQIVDGDIDIRLSPLEWLNDNLPLSIRSIPVTSSENTSAYSCLDWVDIKVLEKWKKRRFESDGEIGNSIVEEFYRAVEITPLPLFLSYYDQLSQCIERLGGLSQFLIEKSGAEAPSLDQIKLATEECLDMLSAFIIKKGGEIPKREIIPQESKELKSISPKIEIIRREQAISQELTPSEDPGAFLLRMSGIPGGIYKDEIHNGCITIDSFSHGIEQNSSLEIIKKGGKGKAIHTDFQINKFLDQSSPKIIQACSEGKIIEEIVLELWSPRAPRFKYMEYRMTNCPILSITPGGASWDDQKPRESLSIRYGKIEWVYFKEGLNREERVYSFNRFASSIGEGLDVVSPTPLLQIIPNSVFILMWMDPAKAELEDVCNAIKEECEKHSLKAIRADDVEHSDQITKVIIDKIKESEFLIADLSGQRPNVYYELGYAHAIGKRAIMFRKQGTALAFDLSVHNIPEYRNISHLRTMLSKRLNSIIIG